MSALGADLVLPEDITLQWQKMSPRLAASARLKAQGAARSLSPAIVLGTVTEETVYGVARSAFPSADLEAVAFIVMMEAASSMDADLKGILAEVKHVNAEKARLVEELRAGNARLTTLGPVGGEPQHRPVTGLSMMKTAFLQIPYAHVDPQPPVDINALSADELRALMAQSQAKLDRLSEMSEMTSLRLQMMMDRRAKFISTLSNILKRLGADSPTLVENFK
jgi:hypothetical protein